MRNYLSTTALGLLCLLLTSRSSGIGQGRLVDAVSRSDIKAIKELLAAGQSPDEPAPSGVTALLMACAVDDVQALELLLKASKVPEATNILHCAGYSSASGSTRTLEYLLSAKKVSVNATPASSPLITLAAANRREGICWLLLTKGADVNAQDSMGMTALHHAAAWRSDIVRVLLARGAKINAVDNRGRSPLHVAIGSGPDAVIRELIRAGARPNAVDKNLRSPLFHAKRQSAFDLLYAANADVRRQDVDGLEPIHYAASVGNVFLVRALLDVGVRGDLKDKTGRSPLDYARSSGNEELIKLLTAGLKKLVVVSCSMGNVMRPRANGR
jgi:ankyrin repeat protein